MSFLQPWLLVALPVALLPIIIHLINQRRFQTVDWAAMQFLLAANRISQGYARIRRWLILAARVAAIAGLILAISRPLSSGWLGWAGASRVDTAIVLLDRSPSMMQRAPAGTTKLQSGLTTIARSLQTLPPARCVLIESGNQIPIELAEPADLLRLPQTTPTAKSADFPALMEQVHDYVQTNRPSRCEVWICSDLRSHDWSSSAGRWTALRKSFNELAQPVRFRLLADPTSVNKNRTLRVTGARRVEGSNGPQLSLDLYTSQVTAEPAATSIPIKLELNGARSEFTVELSNARSQSFSHLVPLDPQQSRGWGQVSIVPDANLGDNQCFFVYDRPVDRNTLIVAEQRVPTEPIEFAASLSSDDLIDCSSQKITPDQWLATETGDLALVVWHATIPPADDPAAVRLNAFVKRGGQLIFFPPVDPRGESFAGVRWTAWQARSPSRVSNWVGDQGPLRRTLGGSALPVGELDVTRSCDVAGEFVALASLDDQTPFLLRAISEQRNVYFCTTTVAQQDSSLAENGVVLYALLHRALDLGVASLGATGMHVAGQIERDPDVQWTQLAGDRSTLSTEYSIHSGVYTVADRLLAINRSVGEDNPEVLDDSQVAELFDGLDLNRIELASQGGRSLVQEIWRLCMALMLLALIAEAALCLPRLRLSRTGSEVSPA